MFKLSTFLALPAVALIATAAGAAEPVKSFKHDGVVYVYQTSVAPDGSTVLTGRSKSTGTPFRLVIKDGKVTGEADYRPVAFSVATSRGAAKGAVAVDTTKSFVAD